MGSKDVTVRLLGDATDLKKKLQDATKGIDDAISMVNSVATKAAIGFGVFGGAIAAFGNEAKGAEQAQLKLSQTLNLVGMETEKNTKILLDNASALSRKSAFSDEEIVNVQSQLLLYGVQGRALNDLTQGIVDYASFSGKDMAGSSQRIAMAIDGATDKVKGLNVNLKGVNGTAERAAIIANALKQQYAGFGATMADGLGTIDMVKKQMGELAESIGTALAPSIVSINEKILRFLDFLQSNPAIINFIAKILLVGAAFFGFILAVSTTAKIVLEVIRVFEILKATFIVLNAIMAANPFILIVAAIAALVVAIIWLIFHWEQFINFMSNVGRTIVSVFENIGNFIVKVFTDPIGLIKEVWEKMVGFFKGIWASIKNVFSGGPKTNKQTGPSEPGVTQGTAAPIQSQTVWYEQRGNQDAVAYMGAFEKAVKGNGDILQAIADEMTNQITHQLIQGLMGGFFVALQGLTTTFVETIISAVGPIFSTMSTLFGAALNVMVVMLQAFGTVFKMLWQGLGTVFGAIWSALPSVVGSVLTEVAGKNKGAAMSSAIGWAYNAAISAAGAVAGIPVVGPALAAAAFAATLGLLIVPAIGIGAIASFAEGGMVPSGEGITKALSPNELVVPESFTSMIKSGDITIGGKDGAAQASAPPVAVNLDGANFHGTFDQGMARMIGEQIAVGIKQNMIAPFPT